MRAPASDLDDVRRLLATLRRLLPLVPRGKRRRRLAVFALDAAASALGRIAEDVRRGATR